MERMHLPENIRLYIVGLYKCLRGKVVTNKWTSEDFKFRKGVFQGDPLSPIVFLMCFNPIIERLKNVEGQYGYNLNGERIITLPFADDFNLVTTDKRRHQSLMNMLDLLTKSMGLKLKPKKCMSLSVSSLKTNDIEFDLGESRLKSIVHDKYHKFLGG
jgi:hypothetical protein